jgi:hypothetical protein
VQIFRHARGASSRCIVGIDRGRRRAIAVSPVPLRVCADRSRPHCQKPDPARRPDARLSIRHREKRCRDRHSDSMNYTCLLALGREIHCIDLTPGRKFLTPEEIEMNGEKTITAACRLWTDFDEPAEYDGNTAVNVLTLHGPSGKTLAPPTRRPCAAPSPSGGARPCRSTGGRRSSPTTMRAAPGPGGSAAACMVCPVAMHRRPTSGMGWRTQGASPPPTAPELDTP